MRCESQTVTGLEITLKCKTCKTKSTKDNATSAVSLLKESQPPDSQRPANAPASVERLEALNPPNPSVETSCGTALSSATAPAEKPGEGPAVAVVLADALTEDPKSPRGVVLADALTEDPKSPRPPTDVPETATGSADTLWAPMLPKPPVKAGAAAGSFRAAALSTYN